MIFAFYSCTRVRWEEGREDPIEEHGWVDRRWDWRQPHESRNDVGPVISLSEESELLAEEVRDALEWLPGGYWNNGDGVFYAKESDSEVFGSDWGYSYALHFRRKFYGPSGWAEEAWIPPASMV